MPGITVYLPEKIAEALRSRAKATQVAVSKIVQEAIEKHLEAENKARLKERVVKVLTRDKPLGGRKAWDRLHKERSESDVGRP